MQARGGWASGGLGCSCSFPACRKPRETDAGRAALQKRPTTRFTREHNSPKKTIPPSQAQQTRRKRDPCAKVDGTNGTDETLLSADHCSFSSQLHSRPSLLSPTLQHEPRSHLSLANGRCAFDRSATQAVAVARMGATGLSGVTANASDGCWQEMRESVLDYAAANGITSQTEAELAHGKGRANGACACGWLTSIRLSLCPPLSASGS